jgi:hypothetical protein
MELHFLLALQSPGPKAGTPTIQIKKIKQQSGDFISFHSVLTVVFVRTALVDKQVMHARKVVFRYDYLVLIDVSLFSEIGRHLESSLVK